MAECVMPLPVHTEIDPEERDQRLGQVYRLLIDLARRRRAAEQAQPAKPVQATIDNVPISGV